MKEDRSDPRSRPALAGVVTCSHDEYLSAFRSLRLNGFILGRATRKWAVKRCRLSSCVLEHGVDAAPWAASGSAVEGAVTFAFSGSPDGRLRVDGREISRDAIFLWPGAARVSIVAHDPASWFVVSVAESELTALAARNGTREPGAWNGPRHVRPEDLGQIRALASRLLHAFETAGPAGLAAGVSASFEQAFLVGLLDLVTSARPARRNAAPRIARGPVLEKVEELLDARLSEPVYVADLCAATGLPERTLRFILVEQYGTSPIRLLRCRRLCQLRRCLQAEGDGAESLARIAARHGFRHPGTFAADYRSLFGELPSETRRSSGEFVPARFGARAVVPPREGLGLRAEVSVGTTADGSCL